MKWSHRARLLSQDGVRLFIESVFLVESTLTLQIDVTLLFDPSELIRRNRRLYWYTEVSTELYVAVLVQCRESFSIAHDAVTLKSVSGD